MKSNFDLLSEQQMNLAALFCLHIIDRRFSCLCSPDDDCCSFCEQSQHDISLMIRILSWFEVLLG